MSIAFMHNPDWLSTEQLPLVFEDVSEYVVVTSGGYDGLGVSTNGLTGTGFGLIRKSISFEDERHFFVGCRLKILDAPPDNRVIIGITDSARVVHCCVSLNTDLSLAIRRGLSVNDDPLRWAVVEGLEVGRWYRLGFKGFIDNTGGIGEIWIDGNPAVQVDEIPTMADDARSSQGGIVIGVAPEFVTGHYYMIDAGRPGHSDLLHDLYVHPEYPVATHAQNTFSPQGAPTVHEATDDPNAHDGDLTAATGSNRYLVDLSVVDARVNRIYGTRLNTVIKSVNAPYMNARFCTVINDRIHAQPGRRGVQADSYQYSADMVELNPATDAPWKREDLNTAGAGFIVESSVGGAG